MSTSNITVDSFRDFRATHGISQADLAQLLKVSGNYIYQVEFGKKPVSSKIVEKFVSIKKGRRLTYIVNGNSLENALAAGMLVSAGEWVEALNLLDSITEKL